MKNLQTHKEIIRQSALDQAFRMIDQFNHKQAKTPTESHLAARDREDMIKKLIKGRI